MQKKKEHVWNKAEATSAVDKQKSELIKVAPYIQKLSNGAHSKYSELEAELLE
ncbi:17342_t:CDS:2 [Cetraspora pellucida]|uniref:17342_t:CDS:1 n=1 Tax=Cetraspora pellucida TaxID=1433469 RepID=A0ACA9KXA5_9GLOM|nr:17342_t:CDS:2 [Cetraspora pellucida]